MEDFENYKVGEVLCTLVDGALTVRATVSSLDDEGAWCSLSLAGSEACEAWSAEDVNESTETFAFGSWFDGSALPVWWGDIDGDGKPELLTTTCKGDLSPMVFRIFRWTGDDLLFLRKSCLQQGPDGQFRWSDDDREVEAKTWVETFVGGKAEVVNLVGEVATQKQVAVEPTSGGFSIIPD